MILTTYAIFLIISEYTVSLELATQHIYIMALMKFLRTGLGTPITAYHTTEDYPRQFSAGLYI